MRTLSPARLVVLSAWGSRMASAFVTIYALRVLSSGLSAAEYATFIIIVGLSGWYALLGDLGVGYATQNSVTHKRATDEDPAPDILMAYILLASAMTFVALISLALSDRISLALLAGVADKNATSQSTTLWWSGVVFAAGASAGASSKILYAEHKGYVANILTAIASLLGLLIVTNGLEVAEMKVLFAICAMYGPPMLFSVVVATLQIRRSWHARRLLKFSLGVQMTRRAGAFLIFNAIAAAVLQVDYIVMSQKVSELEIVQYYNIAKLFAFSAFFNQAIMFAMWPRFTEQFSRGQHPEIARSIDKLVLYGLLVSLGTTAFVMLASDLLSSLLSPGIPVKFRYTVVAGFGALALVRNLTDPYAIFLQSVGAIKPLIVFATIQALIGAALQWILSGYMSIEGILIALVISFLLTAAWGLPAAARRTLQYPATA